MILLLRILVSKWYVPLKMFENVTVTGNNCYTVDEYLYSDIGTFMDLYHTFHVSLFILLMMLISLFVWHCFCYLKLSVLYCFNVIS